MQSSKLPRKNSKSTEPIAAAAAQERVSNSRPSRAKKAKTEEPSVAVGAAVQPPEESVMKHHHSTAEAEPVTTKSAANESTSSDVRPASDVPSKVPALRGSAEVTREMIAQLAHSYWVERGYAHGSAEQDWLRAEQQLRARAATA